MEQPKVGVGVGVMIIRDDKVLLGKRHDDPAKAQSALNGAGTWSMPGGKLKFGETFAQAAARELLEETGMTLTETSVLCVNEDIIETAHFVTLGILGCAEGEPHVREPEQITCWKWFPLEHLPTPLYFPTEKVLHCYKEKKFYKAT